MTKLNSWQDPRYKTYYHQFPISCYINVYVFWHLITHEIYSSSCKDWWCEIEKNGLPAVYKQAYEKWKWKTKQVRRVIHKLNLMFLDVLTNQTQILSPYSSWDSNHYFLLLENEESFRSKWHCPNISTTPITAMAC